MDRPEGQRRSLTDAPVVLPPTAPGATPVPTLGRAHPAPLRREGPDKLTGAALYTDDLVARILTRQPFGPMADTYLEAQGQ